MPGLPADIPPKQLPWQTQPTPELLDGLIVAVYDSENVPREYLLLAPGAPHPDPKKFSGYFFCKAVVGSYNRTQFWFSLGAYQNQDLYNYDLDFVSDSADHPVFVRRYLTRRDVQAAGLATVVRATPFTGVFSIYVTDGGTGYDPEAPPVVTVTGDGTGCTAVALVTKAGVVQYVRITAEGSGFTTAPAVAFSSGTAAATAVIQDPATVLIKQRWQQLPVDDPRYSLFLLETRIYQTFPGPVLEGWDFVPRIFKYAQTERQLVLASTVPADNNASSYADGVTVEYQPLTTVYSAKLTTTLPTTGFVWDSETGDTTDIVYQAFVNWRFPDQILEDPVVEMLVAVAGNGSPAFDFAWDIKVDEGYAGPCVAEVRERYTYNPNDAAFVAALPTPTMVKPQAESVYTGVIYQDDTRAIANFYTFTVPMSLHMQLDIDIEVNGDEPLPTDAETFSKEIVEATEPPAFAEGDELVVVEQPERLGIGKLWMVRIITITHP